MGAGPCQRGQNALAVGIKAPNRAPEQRVERALASQGITNQDRRTFVNGCFLHGDLQRLWKTLVTAKIMMAPQGFATGRSIENCVFS